MTLPPSPSSAASRPSAAARDAWAQVVVALVVLGACLATLVPPAAATPATSEQAEPSRALRVAAVSPWVAPDGEFQLRFDTDPSVGPDAELSVTIFQALRPGQSRSVRQSVEDILDGEAPGRVLRTMAPRALGELVGPTGSGALDIPIRASSGDSERVYVPEAGVHPVEVVLTSKGGPELGRAVVFLNRLPEPDEDAPDEDRPNEDDSAAGDGHAATDVVLVVGLDAPPAIADDGSASFSADSRTRLRAVEAQLAALAGVPLAIAPQPNVLDGLSRSEEQWAIQLLETLQERRTAGDVLRRPYVPLDIASLIDSGGASLVGTEVFHGQDRIVHHLGVLPETRIWALDDSITTDTLPGLALLGTTVLLADPSSLDIPESSSGGRGSDTLERRLGAARVAPVPLEGSDTISVMTPDTGVAAALSMQVASPALRAHNAVTLLMASRFDHATPSGLHSVVIVPPDLDPETLGAFGSTLTAASDASPLRATGDLESVADATPVSTDPEPLQLRGRQLTRLGPVVSRTLTLETQLRSYEGMIDGVDPSVELWDALLLQALERDIAPEDRRSMQDTIVAGLSHQLARIQPPLDRRVVLTSERTELPLRMRNDLPFPVRLTMLTRSPRLDLPAEIPIVLQPGENRIDVPVTVQAPGESLLRIDFRSPDGELTIPGPDVPVRSTAISGVGAALSVISVAFLLIWWLRSIRRSRRHRSDEDAPASTDDATATDRSGSDPHDAAPHSSDTDSVVESG